MSKKRFVLISLLGGLVILCVGAFGGFVVGKSFRPSVIVRPGLREIISPPNDDVTATTSTTLSSSTHSSDFSVQAFAIVGIEMREIVASVLGNDGFRYYAYVLPKAGGFQLVIHHPNSVSAITDTQHQELLHRVRERLRFETKEATIMPPKTTTVEQNAAGSGL